MNKLDRKDFTIAVKTGSDANKSKFAKEAVRGEAYYATDTQNLYFAQSTAGAGDAGLSKLEAVNNFPNIQSFSNTSEFLKNTTFPIGSIVFSKDTNKLYVWDGTNWQTYS